MKKKEWKALANEWYEQSMSLSSELHRTIKDKHVQLSDMADKVAEIQEAAEFEARVAAKVASKRLNPQDACSCLHARDFAFCILRKARLEVEEEME